MSRSNSLTRVDLTGWKQAFWVVVFTIGGVLYWLFTVVRSWYRGTSSVVHRVQEDTSGWDWNDKLTLVGSILLVILVPWVLYKIVTGMLK